MLNEDSNQREEKLELFIPNGPRLGDTVIEATDITKAYDDKVLIEDFSFKVTLQHNFSIFNGYNSNRTNMMSYCCFEIYCHK